jgi:hypothetical protein
MAYGILANPIRSVSGQWNQTHCPLFRLPAELRLVIYELVLGRHTIFIQHGGHQYQKTLENGKRRLTSYPLRGFHCTRLPLDANPYVTLVGSDEQRALRGQQLLNNICRELYLETAVLPYKWNVWSWANSRNMRKMLVEDKMIPRRNLSAINTIFTYQGVWFPVNFDNKDFLFTGLRVLYKNGLDTVTKHIENFEDDENPAEMYQKTAAQCLWTKLHGDPPYDFL